MQLLHCPEGKSTPRFCLSTWHGAAEFRPLIPLRDSDGHSFLCYEKGKTRLSLALVKLLKVLDRHPDLLDEVKVA
jgi:hypothetical protein